MLPSTAKHPCIWYLSLTAWQRTSGHLFWTGLYPNHWEKGSLEWECGHGLHPHLFHWRYCSPNECCLTTTELCLWHGERAGRRKLPVRPQTHLYSLYPILWEPQPLQRPDTESLRSPVSKNTHILRMLQKHNVKLMRT